MSEDDSRRVLTIIIIVIFMAVLPIVLELSGVDTPAIISVVIVAALMVPLPAHHWSGLLKRR